MAVSFTKEIAGVWKCLVLKDSISIYPLHPTSASMLLQAASRRFLVSHPATQFNSARAKTGAKTSATAAKTADTSVAILTYGLRAPPQPDNRGEGTGGREGEAGSLGGARARKEGLPNIELAESHAPQRPESARCETAVSTSVSTFCQVLTLTFFFE